MKICRYTALVGMSCLAWMILDAAPVFALEETGGIGLTVAQLYDEASEDHRGYLVVLDVFKDGPAHLGGVQSGDIITHVNDRMTKSRALNDILKNDIRGAQGDDVQLRIWRSSQKERLKIKLSRVPMMY